MASRTSTRRLSAVPLGSSAAKNSVSHTTLVFSLSIFAEQLNVAAVIATKFMPSRMANGATLDGIRQQLTESLSRLDCGHVDLYYMHRVCTKVPIEDIAQSLKQLQVPRCFSFKFWAPAFFQFCSRGVAERRAHQTRRPERSHSFGAAPLPRHHPRHCHSNRVERWHTGRRGSRSPLPALLLFRSSPQPQSFPAHASSAWESWRTPRCAAGCWPVPSIPQRSLSLTGGV